MSGLREVALSVLSPAAVSALFAWALWWRPAGEAWEERRLEGLASDPGRDLDVVRPSVVVLGNSVAQMGVDPGQLGDLLDLPAEVALLHEPGSLPPTWYLMLDNEVLPRPRAPELVVVVASPPNLLETLPQSDVDFDRMLRHLDGDDPEVEAALDAAGAGWRARRARVALRSRLLDGARDLAVGVTVPWSGGWWGRAHRVAEEAAAAVFPADGGGRDAPVSLDGRAVPDDPSMLVALIARAREAGARVAVVLPPVRAQTAENTSPPEVLAALVEAVEGAGAVWLDLSAPPSADAFQNDHHLNPKGQEWFTQRLASALRREGLRPDRPAPTVLPRPLVRRLGEPPSLPALGPRVTGKRSCGAAFELPSLRHLQDGHPWDASPLRVLQGGVPLARRGSAGAPACRGTFRYVDGVMAVAPDDDGPLTLDWEPSPVLTPPEYRGQQWADRWWVLPGTGTEITLPEGPYTLWVRGEQRGPASAVRVTVDGDALDVLVDGRRRQVLASGDVGSGPAVLQVALPVAGSPLMLNEVALRRPGEDAWTFVVRSGRRPIAGAEGE